MSSVSLVLNVKWYYLQLISLVFPRHQSTPLSVASSEDHLRTEPFSEVHGVTVLIRCESLQFRLQMAVDETGDNMSQVRRKLFETFHDISAAYDVKNEARM